MKITIYSEKGGSGKSTLATVLALTLGVELFDLDAQKSSERLLKKREQPKKYNTGWIIDCPPGISLNTDMREALADADLVLIPVRASYFDFDALPQTVKFLRLHTKGKIGFVGSDIDTRANDMEAFKAVLAGYKLPLLGILTHRASYRRAGVSGQIAGEYDRIAASEASSLIVNIKEYLK